MKGKNQFVVLFTDGKQVDVHADGWLIKSDGEPVPYVRFWSEIPGDDESEEAAVFVLQNIVGFIDLGTH